MNKNGNSSILCRFASTARQPVTGLSQNCHPHFIIVRHNRPDLTEPKGLLMMTDWLAAVTERLLPARNAEPDELSIDFDFALSAEMMDWLYARHAEREINGDAAAVRLD